MGSKPGVSFDCCNVVRVDLLFFNWLCFLTSLLFDFLSRERVQWSIRLIFFLANGFALLTSFLANVVNPNTPHAPATMEVNAHHSHS